MCAAHTAKVSAVPRGRRRGSDGDRDGELELESVSANWLKSLREFAENSCTQVPRLRLWSGLGMETQSGDSWKVAALTPSWGESVSQSQPRFMRNFITRAQWEIGIYWVSLLSCLALLAINDRGQLIRATTPQLKAKFQQENKGQGDII